MDFENEGYVGTAIIYNQEQAIPSGNSPSEEPLWNTYEGSQGLYFIASVLLIQLPPTMTG